MAKQNKNNSSRKETWMRLVVGVVTGILLCIWAYFIGALTVVNFVYGVFTGKRLRELAEMSEVWNTQMYSYKRYMIFMTNTRPFPFTNLVKNVNKFE